MAGFLAGLIRGFINAITKSTSVADEQRAPSERSTRNAGRASQRTTRSAGASADAPPSPGQFGASATKEIAPPAAGGVKITYAPQRDGDPDAGEVVWTWVPYEENDGRGKDRPVLVIGRQSADRVFAVRLTSKDHNGERDFLPIGLGEWDSQGRPSWVDIEQLYSVHHDGMRREASAIDLKRFAVVAQALQKRYGWQVGQ